MRMKAKGGRPRTKTLFIVTTIRSTYTFRWLAYHSPSHYFLASLIYHVLGWMAWQGRGSLFIGLQGHWIIYMWQNHSSWSKFYILPWKYLVLAISLIYFYLDILENSMENILFLIVEKSVEVCLASFNRIITKLHDLLSSILVVKGGVVFLTPLND